MELLPLEQDYSRILGLISTHQNGLSLKEINQLLADSQYPISQRTLQRRLSELLLMKRVNSVGQGVRTRYYRIEDTITPSMPLQENHLDLPISKESQKILAYLGQSVQARKPVSYSYDFLNSYRPNESSYLTPAIKKHLKIIGFSGETDQPAGTFARHIFGRLMIDLSWNSSRLEGNTYSLLETERLIEFGELADDKVTTESQMILNHKSAIEFLIEPLTAGINKSTILNLHAILSENLMKDPDSSGRLRNIPVGISGSVYHPLANPHLIAEYFTQIIDTAAVIKDPFEQSFFLMVHLPYLQPFEDVNKRVSRLAVNIPLFRENLCPLSFVDVSEKFYTQGILGVYELTKIELLRDVYVFAYERSSARYAAVRHTTGEPDSFKFKFRNQIKEIVADIVRKGIAKKQATGVIKSYAVQNIPAEKQTQFLNVVETELISLHEGNFARFGIKLPEFETWYSMWKTPT